MSQKNKTDPKGDLWNLTDGKTKEVLLYVNSLSSSSDMSRSQEMKFDNIKANALSKLQPNDMLKIVGFRYRGYPLIYDWCMDVEK